MATGIPLPGAPGESLMKGIDTGSNMFARIMQPILEREKNKQLGEQFGITNKRLAEQFSQTKALERAKMSQLENHFQQQFGLSKAEASRAALAASDAHKLALQKQNPLFAAQQYEALENYYKSKGQNQGQQMAQPQTMPTQEMGQGQGMFTPQGLQGAQQDMQAQQQANNNNNGGVDLELMKSHPMLRGFYKQKFGVDPLAAVPQTPEEKNAAALDLYGKKEALKAANKTGSGEALTAPIKTKYQNVIGGVASARPILQKLIAEARKGNIPGQMIGSLFKRNAQANYKGEVSTLLDGVRNAYTIPNTDSGTAKAEDKVLRKSGESDENYAKRLEGILAQMDSRDKDARTKLGSGNITTNAVNTVHLVGPNGEDYDVPESEVNAILKEHPGVRRG